MSVVPFLRKMPALRLAPDVARDCAEIVKCLPNMNAERRTAVVLLAKAMVNLELREKGLK